MVRRLLALVSFIVLVTAVLPQRPALGQGMMAIGLDWRKNVFVQEYWKDGKVFYAIANKTDADVAVVVSGRRDGATLAGPWRVKARSVARGDASPLIGKDLVKFDLEGGDSLGLLECPSAPVAFPQAPADGWVNPVVSFLGLNGSGGSESGIWVEQDAVSFAPGSAVEMRLRIPGNKEQLLVKKGDLPAAFDVSCKTLRVTPAKDGFAVDIARPITAQDAHVVIVKFKAPDVSGATMLTLDTWLWDLNRRGGHGITRGVVIEPAVR